MPSINIKMFHDVESETIHVSDLYGYGKEGHCEIQRLQLAVTKKYGIPKEHLQFQYEIETRRSGNYILDPYYQADSSKVIRVFVNKDFVTDKLLKAGTRVFIEDMTKLMEDPETSDFTLKVANKDFKVHKSVLGARSGVFRTMFLSGMQEAVEGEAVITDVDEETLEEVLHYIYTGKLSGKDFSTNSLCYAAAKYQLDTLMDLIPEEIRKRKTELQAEEVAEVFIAGELFGREEFHEIAMGKLRRNKGMLKEKEFEERLNNGKFHKLLYRIILSSNEN